MRIVSRPPRISVFWTSATDSRMKIDVSRTIWISVPGGSSVLQLPRPPPARASTTADGVGLRLLGDVDRHRRLAVDERERPLLFDRVVDRGHVRQADRLVAAPADDHRRVLGRVLRLARRCAAASRSRPSVRRPSGVLTFSDGEAADDLVDAHAERRQPRRVEVDRHFALRRPDQLRLRHARDALQAPLDLAIRQVRQLARRQRLRPHGERDDRHRGEVELLDDRFLHARRAARAGSR